MPFAFWKSARQDETKSPLLLSDDDGAAQEPGVDMKAVRKTGFDPACGDSGKFTFEDMEQLAQWSPTTSRRQQEDHAVATVNFSTGEDDEDAPLLHDEQIESRCEAPLVQVSEDASHPVAQNLKVEPGLMFLPKKETSQFEETTRPISVASNKAELPSHDRDSGLYLSDVKETATPTRPASAVLAHDSQRTRPSSFSMRQHSPADMSTARQQADSTARRLHRPTELNLSSTVTDGSKPQTELEKRFDLMRNSKSQSKAALRSPTALLKERLNMSPSKSTFHMDKKVRVFVPPQPSRNGCLLPGPAGQTIAFTSTSVRARTGATGRPAWWCKTDKLVVFDGIDVQADGEIQVRTRTSKGLSIARRRGDTETIIIPMDCAHCQEMLNRHEWKYDIQVCKRSVCWDCKERCKWEHEQEMNDQAASDMSRTEGNRYRADSVLEDDEIREDDLMRKMGIEQGRPKSPMEAVGGIEERLGNTNMRV